MNQCFNIDDIVKAFDGGDRLVDTGAGGSLNTYEFKCTEKENDVIGAIHMSLSWTMSLLVIATSAFIWMIYHQNRLEPYNNI